MKIKTIFIFLFLLLTIHILHAQVVYDYGFKKNTIIPVNDSSGRTLKQAWVGGLNECQFSEIDLNLDGITDLFVFDKTGNRQLTFINNAIDDSMDYTYDYYYQKYFPDLASWVNLVDYNNDGKYDIFSYTNAGIKVFKNISDSVLKFLLLYPILNANMGSSVSNIGVTPDDYPVFYDIDYDGDLDVLAFFGLGSFVQEYKNLSHETYSNSDTLLLKLSSHCWGDFSENAANNKLTLDITCPWRCDSVNAQKATRHTGSTMLAGDFNGDHLTDLVLGDVDYFNLLKLTNGKTNDSVHMIDMDTLFPSIAHPVNFNSFPVATYIDVNNDHKKELLISPFTSNLTLAESYKSVWLYQNIGDTMAPNFAFVKPNFLQDDMIDFGTGSYPVIYDYNSDGLPDIMVANYGYLDSSYYQFGYLKSNFKSHIAVLQNTGTATNPSFRIATHDYANLSQLNLLGLYPTFGDVDHDGDIDMICGQSTGTLLYFQNTAGAGNIPIYNPPISNYQSIDVGDYSAPQLFDLNNDGLLDLIIGKQNGYLSYYQNMGTLTNPVFQKITDSLGKVFTVDPAVAYTGFSTPCFFSDSNKIKLFVGSDNGRIFYYKNINNNLNGKFTATDSVLIFTDRDSTTLFVKDGIRSGVAVCDFNNDGYKDMVVGNFSGGLTYYQGAAPHSYNTIADYTQISKISYTLYPNPANDKLSINFHENHTIPLRIQIYDIIGNCILEKEFVGQATIQINCAAFNNGLYLCRVLAQDSYQKWNSLGTKKFVIVR
ncbi:MAG: T9SS type A sorting domain-containing protein [Bacteroidota bacterium]